MDGSESYSIGYDYDLDGIRTKKTVTVDSTGTTTTHEYITQNGKIVRETMTSGTATRVFDFIYDANGSPVAVPEKICGLTLILDFFDRCHSLASLHPPPAAVGSLPLRLQVHDQWHDDHYDVLCTEFTG